MENKATDAAADANRYYLAGQLEAALRSWHEAEQVTARKTQWLEHARILLQMSRVQAEIGQRRLAMENLQRADALIQTHRLPLEAAAKELAGVFALEAGDGPKAIARLSEALGIAKRNREKFLSVSILNNLGNAHAGQGAHREAIDFYERCATEAEADGHVLSAARARLNQTHAALALGDVSGVETTLSSATSLAYRAAPSFARRRCLLGLGQAYESIGEKMAEDRSRFWLSARALYLDVMAEAREHKDDRSLTTALGYSGYLYARDGQHDEALLFFQQASFAAQKLDAPDSLYRWAWGAARSRMAFGQRGDALIQYRHAVQTLQGIRHDLTLAASRAPGVNTFRETVGSLFSEMADALLQEAAGEKDESRRQSLLREVRGTLELLKTAELDDYFRDECVNIALAKTVPIEAIAPRTAVLYIVPLPSRTELLLTLPGHRILRFGVAVAESELDEVVVDFRRKLENRTTYEYLRPGRLLHDWLIQPLIPTLRSNSIDTLVFVPDSTLRSIPLGALVDGTNYLAEKYAIGVTPGLTLMGAKPSSGRPAQLLFGGLSQSIDGFPSLEHAGRELRELSRTLGGTVLLDENFQLGKVEAAFAEKAFSIVHIASHGQFQAHARESFLLAYDGRLTLDHLERLIKPSQFRGRPVELLTLSACQTAVGDDRAALGLAGVALKAGARCALASLWSVNDEASALLMTRFYDELRRSPEKSKAHALRAAQMALLADGRYEHPAHWSAFMVIGNWL